MKFSRHIGHLALAATTIFSLASATSCTFDVATSLTSDNTDSGGDIDSTNPDAVAANLEIQAEGEENALDLISGDSDSDIDGNVGFSNDLTTEAEGQANAMGLIGRRAVFNFVGKRAAVGLDCSSSESCFASSDNILLCVDPVTGDFHDNFDGSGNAFTGEYTSSDGETVTVDTPTASATSTGSKSTATSSTDCTADNASAWPQSSDDGGDGSVLAAYIQAYGNAAGTDAVRRKRAAESLECTSGEKCLISPDSSLNCVDISTGEYRDNYGGSGNAFSGVYTGSNGEVQTVSGTQLPSLGVISTVTGATATASRAGRTQTGTASGTGAASTSQDSGGRVNDAGMQGALLAVAVVPLLAAMF